MSRSLSPVAVPAAHVVVSASRIAVPATIVVALAVNGTARTTHNMATATHITLDIATTAIRPLLF
jgi:hypothetical protein